MTSRTPPAAEMVGVTKRFGSVLATDRIDLSLRRGEILGVVGENGAGKTTLMSVLYGLHRPDDGHLERNGVRVDFRSPADAIAAGLGMVHQRFRLFPELTVAENVVIGAEPVRAGGRGRLFDRAAAERAVAALAERHGLDVDPRARVGDLPVGVRQRVEILKALHRNAEILILDEPTAVLTPAEATRLFEVLRAFVRTGASAVLVTHKLAEVLAASDRVVVLREGRVTGRFATAEATSDALIQAMIGRSLTSAGGRPRTEPDSAWVGSEPALEVTDLTVRDADGHSRVSDISFAVRPKEIVGVAGVAGSGQRTLIDAVTGLGPASSGMIRLLGTDLAGASIRRRRLLGLTYVPEDRDGRGTAPALSVARNLIMGDQHSAELRGRFGVQRMKAVARRARQLVARFSIRAGSVHAPLAELSGGNAQKAVLARELARESAVLVVEEPTQGVDVGAQEQIHNLLVTAREKGQAVLLVSSELSEIRALADRVLVMFQGRVVAELSRTDATDEALGAAMTGVVR